MTDTFNSGAPDFGSFLAVGAEGLLISSKDGIHWSEPQVSDRRYGLYSITAGNGCAIVSGYNNSGDNVFLRSTDLTTWALQVRKREHTALRSVRFGGGQFVALLHGENPEGHGSKDASILLVSTDGNDWYELFNREKCHLYGVEWIGDKWIIFDIHGRKSVSVDGCEWQDAENQTEADQINSVAYGNGLVVGVGFWGLRISSSDGLKWGGRQKEPRDHLGTIIFTGKEFVAFGIGVTYTSSNGQEWTRASTENFPVRFAYGNSTFVGFDTKGKIVMSKDGIGWKEVSKAPGHLYGISFI